MLGIGVAERSGFIAGDEQVAKMTAEAMGTMGGYIVPGFTGMPLLVSFIVVASMINLAIGSTSATPTPTSSPPSSPAFSW